MKKKCIPFLLILALVLTLSACNPSGGGSSSGAGDVPRNSPSFSADASTPSPSAQISPETPNPSPSPKGKGEELQGSVAYAAYTAAAKASNTADSYRATMKMNMSMKMGKENMDMGVNANIAMVMKGEDDIDAKIEMRMTGIMPITTIAYIKDGMSYTDMFGMKVKMPVSIEEAMQQANVVEPFEFPESAVKGASVKDVKDGKEYSFTLEGAALSDILLDQMGDLSSSLGGADLTLGDIPFVVVIDNDGFLKSFSMRFSAQVNDSGEKGEISMELTMEFLQIGGVTVDFPKDLDKYMDIGDMLGDVGDLEGLFG